MTARQRTELCGRTVGHNGQVHPSDASAAAQEQFIYADKIGAGPDHPDKRWGLFVTELTVAQAKERYERDVTQRNAWFGIARLGTGEGRPHAYVQMSPRANGVVLQKLNQYGTIEASYTWGAYAEKPGAQRQETADRIFLSQIYFYGYPDENRFLQRFSSLGHVEMTFSPDGRASESRVTKRGFGEPSQVETREYEGVDVTANWARIPEFGDWAAFFAPEVP